MTLAPTWWRRGESNSRPKTLPQELLRAQTVILGVLLSQFPFLPASRHADGSGELHRSWRGSKLCAAHVHHETTPVPGPWSSRVRRPLFKQRRERYRYRSLIYKLPVFRWSGATARYSCFRVPVETGTPPRRHKVCSAPFPPGGESCAGSLAPPHRTGPACAGLRFGWRLRRRARSSYFNPAGHSAPQA